MAIDFSKFDNQINAEQLKTEIAEAAENGGGYKEIPDGSYIVKLERLEIGETGPNSKGGAGRPMLKAMFRITEGEYANGCLFVNRVLYGTKNDAAMIASALGFLRSLDSGLDIAFESYSQFADLVLDVFEEVADALEYDITYEKDDFNQISIVDVFEA